MQSSGIEILKDLYSQKLSDLENEGRLRMLRPLPVSDGNQLDLTHNDYLGLRHDSAFQEAVYEAAKAWPMGAGASRLLGGEHAIYEELERKFSDWKGSEASLYFNSGFAANEGLLTALAHPSVTFFSDSLNHASLIDGFRLAKLDASQKQIFAHNDLKDLRNKLQASKTEGKVIVTETLFSMDGDFAPISGLIDLAEEFHAVLVMDEAHALGVMGKEGAGLVSDYDAKNIITINPCGKAMAGAGALVSGPEWLRQLLINKSRSFIYSTGASPWSAAGLNVAIDWVRKAKAKRVRLQMLGHSLRDSMEELGFSYGESNSHIVPLLLGDEARSLAFEEALRSRGILARAIRPPTVPVHGCRIRFSLNANISSLEPLIEALKDIS